MIRFVQALEPRRLLSGAPSDPAVAAAVAKVEADVVQMHTPGRRNKKVGGW